MQYFSGVGEAGAREAARSRGRSWLSALRASGDLCRRVAAPGVNVPLFSADFDMATAILRDVEEAWRPLSIEVKRRGTTDSRLAC